MGFVYIFLWCSRVTSNFRLFACYNDGIINLLEKYFDMNKKNCRDALDLYKKFLIRMDRVGEFLKVNLLIFFACFAYGQCRVLTSPITWLWSYLNYCYVCKNIFKKCSVLILAASLCLRINIQLIVAFLMWTGGWKCGDRQRWYSRFDKGAKQLIGRSWRALGLTRGQKRLCR